MNCGIIAVGMGIILSIIANFSEHCSNLISTIGKNLSIIRPGLNACTENEDNISCTYIQSWGCYNVGGR